MTTEMPAARERLRPRTLDALMRLDQQTNDRSNRHITGLLMALKQPIFEDAAVSLAEIHERARELQSEEPDDFGHDLEQVIAALDAAIMAAPMREQPDPDLDRLIGLNITARGQLLEASSPDERLGRIPAQAMFVSVRAGIEAAAIPVDAQGSGTPPQVEAALLASPERYCFALYTTHLHKLRLRPEEEVGTPMLHAVRYLIQAVTTLGGIDDTPLADEEYRYPASALAAHDMVTKHAFELPGRMCTGDLPERPRLSEEPLDDFVQRNIEALLTYRDASGRFLDALLQWPEPPPAHEHLPFLRACARLAAVRQLLNAEADAR